MKYSLFAVNLLCAEINVEQLKQATLLRRRLKKAYLMYDILLDEGSTCKIFYHKRCNFDCQSTLVVFPAEFLIKGAKKLSKRSINCGNLSTVVRL